MRTLTSSLTANQKSLSRPPLLKAVLTKTGQTTQTYDISSSTNRILSLVHNEQEWSQSATVLVDSDATLAALSLYGYTGTISYGYNDASAGDEYSACAPLTVVAQKSDTILNARQSMLLTWFSMAGIFDMMQADHASESYTQEDTDTRTVKTLLTAIAQATLTPFSHCLAYTITYDSEDSLIDTYIPKDYFAIGFNETRLSAFRKLLATTKCKARIEADGAIHVFNPTVSGATYAYSYNDAASNHNFFEKSTRQRLVIPTKWIVSDHPQAGTGFTGNAADSDSESALGRSLPEYRYIRAVDSAQCTAIATALLQQAQVAAEKGHGEVPMNCGQEVMDYVNIVDSVAGDSRAGNIGSVNRQYSPGNAFKMEIRFGAPGQEMPFMSVPSINQTNVSGGGNVPGWDAYNSLVDYIDQKDQMLLDLILGISITTVIPDELVIKKLTVTQRLVIPPS